MAAVAVARYQWGQTSSRRGATERASDTGQQTEGREQERKGRQAVAVGGTVEWGRDCVLG
jgi:hypothetical protein